MEQEGPSTKSAKSKYKVDLLEAKLKHVRETP
jgi:hypothetical protein